MGDFWKKVADFFSTPVYKVDNNKSKHSNYVDKSNIAGGIDFAQIEPFDPMELSPKDRKKLEVENENRVFQKWMLPESFPDPILENPTDRYSKYRQYNYYFLNDDIAGSAIRSLSKLILSSGYKVNCIYSSPEPLDWIPQSLIDLLSQVDAYKDSAPQKAVSEYVISETSKVLSDNVQLDVRADDILNDGFLYGDCYLFIVQNWDVEICKGIDAAISLQEKTALIKQAKEKYGEFKIFDVQQLSPSAVKTYRNELGQVLYYEIFQGNFGKSIKVDPYLVMDYKLNAPDYLNYGESLMHPALRILQVKESLDRALKAFADRYALPVKFLKVGMTVKKGDSEVVYCNQDLLNQASQVLRYVDPSKGRASTVPYFYNLEMIGVEGKMPRVERLMDQLNHRLLMSMEIPEVIVTGTYSNYATARVVMSTLIAKMQPHRVKLKKMLETFITKRLATMRGWFDKMGEVVFGQIQFKDIDVGSEDSLRSLLLGLLQLKATGVDVVSLKTARDRLGFIPEVEKVNIEEEARESDASNPESKIKDKVKVPDNPDENMRLPSDHKLSPKETFKERTNKDGDHTTQRNASYLERLIDEETYIDELLNDDNKIKELQGEVEILKNSMDDMQEIIDSIEEKKNEQKS